MKPLEYCLDRILEELEENWVNENTRPPLNRTELFIEFEMTKRHDEHFMQLIDILKEKKLVEIKDNPPRTPDNYQTETLITVLGTHLLSQGGFQAEKVEEKRESQRRIDTDARLSIGTILLAIGTFLLVAFEALKWFSGE